MSSKFFTKVAENLYRRESSGVYYVIAKIKGRKRELSLKTKILSLAKKKRDEQVQNWRNEAEGIGDVKSWKGLRDQALNYYLNPNRRSRPLKSTSIKFYEEVAKTLPETFTGTPLNFTREDAERWWAEYKVTYHGNRANTGLSMAKRMGSFIERAAPGTGNVFSHLHRLPRAKRKLVVPAKETFLSIIDEIRRMDKVHSEAAGNFVEFIAYSGLRLAEIKALEVQDITERFIIVRGGVEGTKNHEERAVDIIQPMAELLQRMELPESGKVFYFRTYPRFAISNACKRLKIKHLSPHDFRHFFATICVESGVDFATVAKWLGHSDGGLLAAETYSHIRDKHTEEMAAKVRL